MSEIKCSNCTVEKSLDDLFLELAMYREHGKSDHFNAFKRSNRIIVILGVGRAFNEEDVKFFNSIIERGYNLGIWSQDNRVVVGIWP